MDRSLYTNNLKNWFLTALLAVSAGGVCADNLGITTHDPVLVSTEITPLAGPVINNWAELYVTADFIYWQARQDGLAFAQNGTFTFPPTAKAKKGTVAQIDFGFEPGFKVGLGANFKHDGWDLYANYTWLQDNDIHGRIADNPTKGALFSELLIPTDPISNPVQVGPLELDSAHAHWCLHFNVLDLELGRHFYISRHLALRPFIGMKGALINQRYRVYYYNIQEFAFDGLITARLHQDFWGVGLRGGLNTEWHINRNWSFYGNMAAAELYGQFQDTRQDVATDLLTSGQGVIDDVGSGLHTIKPVLEMGLGVRYETFFSRDRYQLFVQAGWEQQVWFDHNHMIDRYEDLSGDLVLQGLDVKFGFNF